MCKRGFREVATILTKGDSISDFLAYRPFEKGSVVIGKDLLKRGAGVGVGERLFLCRLIDKGHK